jgi:cation-transporting ATPase E
MAEAARRRRLGPANVVTRRPSRSAWAVVRANVFTRFNAIIGVLLAVVLVFGQPQDGLFGLVIVVNSAVGIVQELRAKRTLDRLALLQRALVRVRRDGGEAAVPPEDLVVGEVQRSASWGFPQCAQGRVRSPADGGEPERGVDGFDPQKRCQDRAESHPA